uniref:HTH OST-type domain-containing protein n=1 Tax=Strongyloides stercoralis TaxID=6248 RepID=A0A0K0E1J6_STRER
MSKSTDFVSLESVTGYIKSATLGKNNVNLEDIITRVRDVYNLNLVDYVYKLNFGTKKSIDSVARYIETLEGGHVEMIKTPKPIYLVSFQLSNNSIKAAKYCRQTKDKKEKKKKKLLQSMGYSWIQKSTSKNQINNNFQVNNLNVENKFIYKGEKINDPPKKSKGKVSLKKCYDFPTIENSPGIFQRISFVNDKVSNKIDSNSTVDLNESVDSTFRNPTKIPTTNNPPPHRTFGSTDFVEFKEKRNNLVVYKDVFTKVLDDYQDTKYDMYNDIEFGTKIDTNKYLTTQNSKNDPNLVIRYSSINKPTTNNIPSIRKDIHTNCHNSLSSINNKCFNNKIETKNSSCKLKKSFKECLYLDDYKEEIILTNEMKYLLFSFSMLSIH